MHGRIAIDPALFSLDSETGGPIVLAGYYVWQHFEARLSSRVTGRVSSAVVVDNGVDKGVLPIVAQPEVGPNV